MIVKKRYSKEIIELLRDPKNRLAWEEEAVLSQFATQIDKKLIEIGLSQSELAKKVGKAPQAISRALGGDQNLTIRFMLQVAMGLGMTVGVKLDPLENIEESEARSRTKTHTVASNYKAIDPEQPSPYVYGKSYPESVRVCEGAKL